MNPAIQPAPTTLNDEQQKRLTVALEHYLDQLERGELPDLDRLCQEYPDLVDSLRQYIPSLRKQEEKATPSAEVPPIEVALNGSPVEDALPVRESDPVELPDSDDIPKRLGDFELLEEIGRGGMGIVFKARQVSLDRMVAVKILPHAAVWDSKQIARFQNEAQAAAQLSHPNIVSVYAIGKERGTYYYSMPLVEGLSLEQAVRSLKNDTQFSLEEYAPNSSPSLARNGNRKSRVRSCKGHAGKAAELLAKEMAQTANSDEARERKEALARKAIQKTAHIRAVIEMVAQAAEALHYAHQHGIVHRDIKPSNLLVDQHGKLWITDFGLAQVSGFSGLTCTGDVLGTLKYMSPEQASGKTHWVDLRSDIYSLGITMYELLTLHPVVDSEDRMTMLKQIQIVSPPSVRLRNPAISQTLENILLKAIAKDREERYASAELFAEDLRRFLASGRSLANRPGALHTLSRMVRRNAQWSVLVLMILLSLLGTTLPFSYWVSSQNLKMGAQAARTNQQLRSAHVTMNHIGLPVVQQLQLIPGTESLQSEMSQEIASYLESFTDHAQQNSSFRSQLGNAQFTIASLYEQFAPTDEAMERYLSAKDKIHHWIEQGTGYATPADLFLIHHALASLRIRTGMLEPAIKELRTLLESEDQLPFLTSNPEDARFPYWEALVRLDYAMALALHGSTLSAEKQLKHAAVMLQAIPKSSKRVKYSDEASDRMLVSNLLQNANLETTDAELAHRLIEMALSITSLEKDKKRTTLDDQQLAQCYLALALNAQRLGESHDSILWYQKGTQLTESLTKREPGNFRLWHEHAMALNSLGQVEFAIGDLDGAGASFGKSVEVLEDIDRFQASGAVRSSLAGALHNMAAVAIRNQQPREARPLLERAIQRQKQALESTPDSTQYQSLLQQHQKTLDELKNVR
jgi:eukaryotic-like serine/threonine-protein kinase